MPIMPRHDLARDIEVMERSVLAFHREARHPPNELHRRIIAARSRARRNETDLLVRRINATLSAS
jgi:hypothetical protein